MIDASGNIYLDKAADLLLPLSWRDDTGAEIDISAADLTFSVKNKFTLIPLPDPDNPLGRLLHFTEQHAAELGSNARDYMLRLAEGEHHTVLMRGTLTATGWL